MKNLVKKNKRILVLLLLVLVFFGPLVLAKYLYENATGFFSKTINYGQILQPPLDFTKLAARSLDGDFITAKNFQNKWIILYFTPSPCSKACQDNLHKLGQAWSALGKDQDRVKRLMVVFPIQKDKDFTNSLEKEFSGIQYGLITTNHLVEFLDPLGTLKDNVLKDGAFFLVDPQGNLMMMYPANLNFKELLKDLVRLLDASNIE